MDDSFFIGLAVLALALMASGPVACLVLIAQRGRIGELEARLGRLERAGPPKLAAQTAARPEAPPATERPAAPSASQPPAWSPAAPAPARPTTVPPVPPAPSGGQAVPSPSIEELFGTRWTVWIGGLALAMGAALLVRYSVEQGFFGPGVRVACAFALALGLLGGGEALRRRLRDAGTVPERWPDIPAMVTAAGIAALFGAIYASYVLYGFIGPELAFIGLAATGLGAMVAALLHGPTLAGMGLVGALATPLLVGKPGGSLWPMVLYLPAVVASAYGFAWFKGWRALAVTAGVGAAAWALLLAVTAQTAASMGAALLHAGLQAALATGVFAVLPHRGASDAWPSRSAAAALAVAGLALVAVLGLRVGGDYGAVWIGAALAAVALPAAAAFLAPASAVGLLAAGVALAAVVVLWPPDLDLDWTLLPMWPETRDPGLLLSLAAVSGPGVAAIGALRLLGGGRQPVPTALIYAAGATLTPLAALALCYLRIAGGAVSPSFAAAAGVLAAAMTAAAVAFRHEVERTPNPVLTLGLGAFASAAVASLALGLVFAVSGGSLTVAMALAGLGTAAIARRLDIPALRWCVAGLGLVVAARLAYDPTVVGRDLGRTPILNWLLAGYGVPALAFGAAARLIRLPGRAPDVPVLIAEALGLVLAAFLVFFEIRHALHGGDIFSPDTGLVEQGLMALSWLAFALALVRLDGVHGSPVVRFASLAFGALAFLQSAVGLGLTANPYFTDEPISGGLVLNDLTLAYGLPAVGALVLAQQARARRPAWYVYCAGALGAVLAFAGLSLLIRHAFQGAELGFDRTTGQGEWYAYSAGWLTLGLVMLGYGILRASHTARLASAALVGLAIVKVFLFDLAGLDGPLRALSFLGLGAVLIGIGLVYQRFVFAPASRAEAP